MGSFNIMRLLPLFILLLLFSAALLLCYMAWVGVRGPLTMQNEQPTPRSHPSLKKFYSSSNIQPPILIGEGDQSFDNMNQPRSLSDLASDSENEGLPASLMRVNDDVLRDPDLTRKIELLKMRVISKLRRHILNGAKVKGHLNEYGVDFTKLKPKSQRIERKKVLCRLKGINLKLIHSTSNPELFEDKTFPDAALFGNREGDPFTENIVAGPLYKSCAIIPNSAALDGAKHGIDIDTHDFIIRFNNAPTAGYESDVGSLTSLRIVNSQVVTKPQFHFFPKEDKTKKIRSGVGGGADKASNDKAANITTWIKSGSSATDERITKQELDGMDITAVWEGTPKFLIWDPCPYKATLEEWFDKPDFPLFSKYFNLTLTDRNRFYLLDCRVIWKLWELLQEFSFVKIYGNPPTSGFIGIMIALQVCERVNIYEYIPSIRESTRCHYYGPKNESNPSCTYGSWHPVSAEKLFFLALSDGTDKAIFMDGVLTLPGVATVKNC